MLDSRAVLDAIKKRRADWEADRLADAEIDLFDGLMRHRGPVWGNITEQFEWVDNDAGAGSIKLPLDHYLVPWIVDHKGRDKRDIHVRFRKQGAQWDGRLQTYKISRESTGEIVLELVFQHCFDELKNILVWNCPFTPAPIQFPRIFAIASPHQDWNMALTLWLNVVRLEGALFTIPGDPFDPDQWPQFDMSNWSIVVVPVDFAESTAPPGYLYSRFQPYTDVVAKALKASQLSIECFRYYDGDPVPEGLGFTPRHGALVVRFVDHSGWLTGTCFFGNILTGLERAVVEIGDDGFTETVSTIPGGDPATPDEYYEPGWRGTRPAAPWIVLDGNDRDSGVIEATFDYYPATGFNHVAGGKSAPGINEGIGALITGVGNFLGSTVNVPGYAVGLSGLGASIDAVAKPLYTDTIGAWQTFPAPLRETQFGPFGPKEVRAGGDLSALTLGAFAATYASIYNTRERTGHKVKFLDALPYRIGPTGFGDMWIGSRVAVRPAGVPHEYDLFCDQIKKIEYSREEDGVPAWEVEVGWKEPEDPLLSVYEEVRDLGAMASAGGL